jgi:hypothetical protein
MEEARGAEGAEVKLTVLSNEGDPIHRYLRYEPAQEALTIFVDNTDDPLGIEGWLLEYCPDAEDTAHPGHCSTKEVQAR